MVSSVGKTSYTPVMPFTDEQPFLDAVFARYHDDGPRLVYADFLEDTGDSERAELVRVQLALARMTEEHPRRSELANREAELLNLHRDRWTDHLGGLVVGVEFRRGVPDSVSVDSAAFLSRGEELFESVRVRRLRLLDDASLLPKLIHSPHLANVRELDLCDNDLGNGGVELLARSSFLKNLEALDLGFNGIDDAGVVALARASTFPALSTLDLNDNGQITSDGLKALAESPFFAGLTTLDVSGNDINDAGVRAALGSLSFARLHTFRLSRNPIADAGAAALARSALLGRMLARSSRLELRGHPGGPIGQVGAAALAASPALAKCVTLDLTGNDLGDRGLAALVASPHLASLRVLKAGRNQITDAGNRCSSRGAARPDGPAPHARSLREPADALRARDSGSRPRRASDRAGRVRKRADGRRVGTRTSRGDCAGGTARCRRCGAGRGTAAAHLPSDYAARRPH